MVLAMASIGWNYSLNSDLIAVSHCHNDYIYAQQLMLMDTPNLLLQQQQQQQMSVPTTTMYSKFTESTAIVTMSLRGNGDLQGNIFVLTNHATHYETIFSSDKKVHVRTAKEEDLHPVDPKTQQRLV
jgi:ABC-type nitrate/sulfonate/bicarbonate transport system ATPase subunit